MKRIAIGFISCFSVFLLCVSVAAVEEKRPSPFGFVVDQTSYAEALDILGKKNWAYREYEKKQFKEIGKQSAERGKRSFLVVKLKKHEGLRGLRLFFSSQGVLDAIIINLYPSMFPVVMAELDQKYKVVSRNLRGEGFSTNYTHVLYEKDNLYIELQSPSTHNVRIVYVSKLLYENYKDFFLKTYESFRTRQHREDWMNEL